MNYNHLTIEERCCIRKYYNDGKSFREIAELVGRNVSTISREIWRNKTYMNCKPDDIPLDIRGVFSKRQCKGVEKERKNTKTTRERRKVYNREKHTKTR